MSLTIVSYRSLCRYMSLPTDQITTDHSPRFVGCEPPAAVVCPAGCTAAAVEPRNGRVKAQLAVAPEA